MRNDNARVPDFNSFKTHSGDTHHVTYSSKLNSDGTVSLVESGRVDIQAEINSHASETDMAVIVERLMFGDTSVLTSKKPMYGDFTHFPSTFAEAYDLVSRSESAFESLPVSVKQSFDNDRAKWFASIGSDFWFEAMGIDNPKYAVPESPPFVEPSVSEDAVTE